MIGQTYSVIARGSGTHVDVYENNKLKGLLGCFPVDWFEYFEAVDQPEAIEIIETASDQVVEEDIFEVPEEPALFEQMKLF
jgi:hypothetical protein